MKKLVINIFFVSFLFFSFNLGAQTFLANSKIELEGLVWTDLGLQTAEEFHGPVLAALNTWIATLEPKPVQDIYFKTHVKKSASTTESWDKIWNFSITIEVARKNTEKKVICEKEFSAVPIKIKMDDFKSFNSTLGSVIYKEIQKNTETLLRDCPELEKSIYAETTFSYGEALGICQKLINDNQGQCKVDSFSPQKTVLKISKISSIESASEFFLKLGYNLEAVKEDYFKLQRK